MKRSILFGSLLGIVLAWVFLTPAGVSADAGWSCPAGTTLSWTDNDIPDETFSFTVPNSPWNLIAAKAGTGHQVFGDGTVGLNNQTFTITGRNAISHIDYCKVTTVTPTTTEVPPSTSTTTTTTTPPSTSSPTSTSSTSHDVHALRRRRLFPRARLRLHRRRAPRPHPCRPQRSPYLDAPDDVAAWSTTTPPTTAPPETTTTHVDPTTSSTTSPPTVPTTTEPPTETTTTTNTTPTTTEPCNNDDCLADTGGDPRVTITLALILLGLGGAATVVAARR